jgi:hypothetical protein
MFRALQGMGDDDQCAATGHRTCQGNDIVCRNAADPRGPGGILRLFIEAAEQIILEHGIADTETIQES